jgi:hypothetical protein
MSDDAKELQEVYNKIYELAANLIIKEKIDPQMVAATLMAQALKMYKSILTEEDFKKMVVTITESVDKIIDFNGDRTIN